MITFRPFPVIETEHLILRKMTQADIPDIYQMRKDARMHEHTDTKPDENIEETEEYIDKMIKGIDENKWIIWAIEHKASMKVIGSICIWNIDVNQGAAELGYGIIPDYQGKGFMKEALLRVVEYGFHLMCLKALAAFTEENNVPSKKLLESCKFKAVDELAEQSIYSGRVFHMVVYRLANAL